MTAGVRRPPPLEVVAAVRCILGDAPPAEAPLRLALAVGDIEHGADDDREWFARHHGRNHRLRKPIGVSEHLVAPRVDGARAIVLVRQVEPGSRCRAFSAVRGPMPLNSEAVAERLFDRAIDGAEVTLVERYRR
jgi:hypothetical protein